MAWFGAPSEQEIQAKMQRIEQARQIGSFIDPKEMDAAGQEALKRLLAGGQVAQGQPIQQPQSSQQAPPAPQGPPPAQTPPMGQPQPQNVAPEQGGIWADAEAMQKKRAMAGVPTVQ